MSGYSNPMVAFYAIEYSDLFQWTMGLIIAYPGFILPVIAMGEGFNSPVLHFGHSIGSAPVMLLQTSNADKPSSTGKNAGFSMRSKHVASLSFMLQMAINPKYLILFVKPARQHVLHKPPNELNCIQRDGFSYSGGFVILIVKSYLSIFTLQQPVVWDGYPMGVISQIFYQVISVRERFFAVDDPIFGVTLFF